MPIESYDTMIKLIYDAPHDSDAWLTLFDQLDTLTTQSPLHLKSYESMFHGHFKRSFTLHEQYLQAQEKDKASTALIAQMPLAMLVVAQDGSVVMVNDKATQVMDDQTLIHIDAGEVCCDHPQQHQALRNSIRLFALGKQANPGEPFVLSNQNQHISLWVASSQVPQQQWATIYMTSTLQQLDAMQTLQDVYHLSQAEIKLVKVLTHECHNLNDAATSLGVSVHTARTQLKHVFKKTNTRSQVELVKKVLNSPEVKGSHALMACLSAQAIGSSAFKLYDGRYLAYREFGDAQGYPVLYFHSTTGGELECGFAAEFCQQHAIRLLSLSRPGYGESDPCPTRTAASWVKDVQQLLQHLAIEQCAIIGYSSGGPYGLACCALMPEMVSHLSLVATPGLRPNKNTIKAFSKIPFYRVLMQMVLVSPALTLQAVRLSQKLFAMDVQGFWRKIDPYLCPQDKQHIQEHGNTLKASFKQGNLQGGQEAAKELALFMAEWGFEVQDIQTPITIWHGEQDPFTPISIAQHMAQQLQDVQLNCLKDKGFYILNQQWENIILDIQATAHTAPANNINLEE